MIKSKTAILPACLMIAALLIAGNSDRAGASRPGDETVQTVPESCFGEAFRQFISSRLDKDINDIILSRLKVTGNRSLPAGEVSLRIMQQSAGDLNGYVRLVALVSVDDVPYSDVQLSGWIDLFDTVVCASRDLDKGTVITRDDVHLVKENISRQGNSALTDVNQAIGLTLGQDVKKNNSLKDRMLKKTPIVNRGDIVTILAEGYGIRVTVPGRILEKGCPGEYVRVQNTMSGKNISARVVDNSTVFVDFIRWTDNER